MEPSEEDLSVIETEEPVITAGVAVVDAECQMLLYPSELTHRAHRRAVANLRHVMRAQRTARVRIAVVKPSKSVA